MGSQRSQLYHNAFRQAQAYGKTTQFSGVDTDDVGQRSPKIDHGALNQHVKKTARKFRAKRVTIQQERKPLRAAQRTMLELIALVSQDKPTTLGYVVLTSGLSIPSAISTLRDLGKFQHVKLRATSLDVLEKIYDKILEEKHYNPEAARAALQKKLAALAVEEIRWRQSTDSVRVATANVKPTKMGLAALRAE